MEDFIAPYAGQNVEPPKLVAQVAHGLLVQPTAGRYCRQLPATHSWVLPHALPQPPQLSGSVAVLTQAWRVVPPAVTLHRLKPVPQVVVSATQTPALHSWPAAQALPQPPQAKGLLEVSTHWLTVPPNEGIAHCVRPGRQVQVPEPLQY